MAKKEKFISIIEQWKIEKKKYVKESTFAAYALIVINHIEPYFGKYDIIKETDVQEFVLKKSSEGLSQKTIKDILIVLKMIIKFGCKKNNLPYLEIEVTFPSNVDQKKELEVLSKENQKKIMKYVRENFSFKNLGILICLNTGMRIGELCALSWNDIDLSNGTIKIRKTIQRIYVVEGERKFTKLIIDKPKTANSVRDIPISTELMKTIKPLMKLVNGDYFILSNDSKPIEPRTYRVYYKKIIDELGIPQIKFHGLRHSFATRCIESNSDYKTVSSILGHSNISTTLNLYVHPNKEQKKKCIDKMLKSL